MWCTHNLIKFWEKFKSCLISDDFECGNNKLLDKAESIVGTKNNPETNPVGHWPWMASLGFYKEGNWTHQCGATLISRNHFLTAAHCLKNNPKK